MRKNRTFFLWAAVAASGLAQSPIMPIWAPKAPVPAKIVMENAAVTINGKMYVVTPWNLFEYDPRTDQWAEKKKPLTFRHDFEAVALNGKLYVIGGCTGGDQHIKTAAVEEYDPTTDAWRARAPMPTARMALAVAASGGKIYVIGGQNPKNPVSAVEVYDPATDTWTKRRDWARTNLNALAVEAVPGKIHVLARTREEGKPFVSFLDEYDPATDTFRELAVPPKARGCAALAAVGGRLVAFGGHGEDDQAVSTVEVYDPARNAWKALVDLPEARSCPAAVEIGGQVYVVGGSAQVAWRNALRTMVAAEAAALR